MKENIIPITLISIFSVLLWGSVSLSDEYFTTITMPVRIADVPSGMSLADYSPRMVTVNVKGEGWQIAGMTYGRDLDFVVPIGNKSGIAELDLEKAAEKNYWMTSSIQLVDVKPEKLQYTIEELVIKKVPIVPELDLQFKSGYDVVSKISVKPDSVEISGPASIVNEIDTIKTTRTRFAELFKSVSTGVSVQGREAIKPNPEQVLVEFDVQKIVDKVFEGVTVETRNVPSFRNLNLYPDKINIVLRGGINTLGTLTSDDLKPFVTFKQAMRDTSGVITPVVSPPDFTKLIDTKPNKLEYIIKKY